MRAGPLPKVMPVSLVTLNLCGDYGNAHKFTGGLPPEWSSMTNLKELRMAFCGLDGECLVYVQCLHREQKRESGGKHRENIRAHTRNVPRAFLCAGAIPASIGGLSNLQTLDLRFNGRSGSSCVFLVLDQCLHREELRESGRKF